MARLYTFIHSQFFIFIICLTGTLCFSQTVPIGLGNYNLSKCNTCAPGPAQSTGPWTWKPADAKEKVIDGFSQHMTTNEWWTSFMWDLWDNNKHSSNTWAIPSVVKAHEYGMRVFKNRMWTIQNVVSNTTRQEYGFEVWPRQAINVGVTGMKTDTTKVVSYGDWNVKVRWNNLTGITLDATTTAGSPYVYFEKTGGDIDLWTEGIPTVDNTIGTNVIGITVEGSNFGIFLPQGSTYTLTTGNWEGAGDFGFRSSLNGRNYMAVAALPDNSLATLTTFARHAFVFIEGTTVNWNFNEAAARLTTTFSFQTVVKEGTENNILTTLFPHQWKNSTAVTNTITFDSPRGTLKCITANSFETVLSNYGILTQLPLTGNFPDLMQYIEDEASVPDHVESGDNYLGGGQMAKLADLMEVAHYVGHEGAKTNFLTELKSEMENWLTSPTGEAGGHYLYYNSDWQTLTPYDAYLGAEMQNDHHFSYGYMVRAAATIAKYDPEWARDENWGGMVKHIIRHVNSWDRNDTKFPFLRYMSPYFGHSFAGGHANGNNGNGQESSSEAINFGAAVYLWGVNTQDNTIRDLGLYLYLTEVESAKQYWWNVDGDNFPTGFAGNHIWNMDGHGAGKWTWFGDRPEYGLGINLLPIDAHSLYLAHNPDYCARLYANFLSDTRDYNEDVSITEETVWEDVFYAYRSMYEAEEVIARYESYGPMPYFRSMWNRLEWNPEFSTFNSQPPAHFYHFIHAIDSLGQVNPSILSDYSSYGVFDKFNCRHYVMYNPPGAPTRTVNFTDGKSFFLPEDTTITYKFCDPLPVTWLDFTAMKNDSKVKLNWQTSSEKNNSHFIVQRSKDGKSYQNIGRVEGNGTLDMISSYMFYDDQPLPGKNYYRLKQMDINGAFNYSVIRIVHIEEDDRIIIYPNPSSDKITISTASHHQIEKISLMDVLGRIVYTQSAAHNPLELDITDYSNGTYIAEIQLSSSIIVKKKLIKGPQ